MDRFDAMAMLLEVVERGSFSAASRSLRVPLATLSRRVSDLEKRLGTRLLTRTTRRLSLTDAGTAYVAAARRILEQLDEAERNAAGEFVAPKGELVLTAARMSGLMGRATWYPRPTRKRTSTSPQAARPHRYARISAHAPHAASAYRAGMVQIK